MAFIIEIKNPMDPLRGMKKNTHPGGISIRAWLELEYPGFTEFQVPTVCRVNGKPLLRKNWDRIIRKKDIVNFIPVAGGWELIVVALIVVIAVALTLLLKPNILKPGNEPESDPVFTTKGQINEVRLGEPIEVCYGRNRVYPSMASYPFFQYENNNQFQNSLFCLGQGQYEIEEILIGDTNISSYQEVEYEVIPPGSNVTLFSTNVETSVEVGGQTLFAPNEPEYVVVGPFPANSPGTVTNYIEVDFTLPKGLYHITSKGKIEALQILVTVEARLINDAGAPLGPYSPIINLIIELATTTPQRVTLGSDVPEGRYEIIAYRTDIKTIDSRSGHDVALEGMKAWIVGEEIDFGDVTLLAMKIRATNNLNNSTAKKVNVICTRKLPIFESGGFSAPVVTRSIVWAFCDIFRARYGGRIPDSFFDTDTFLELETFYEDRDEHFDWQFRDAITVWEAAKVVARCGRAVPLLVGSLVTMRRDGPLDLPVTLFGQDNIVRGSFKWEVKLWDLDEFDSVSIEYTDPTTGYKQENVLCTLPGGTTDNPQDLRLPGIQSRACAYHEGLFMLATTRYIREVINFDTGMEGHIPTYGDLIAISHDVPNWGQSGIVVNAVRGEGIDYTLFLSEPLDWTESGAYQIMLRGRQAEMVGPFTAHQTDDPMQVLITIAGDEDYDFMLDGTTEPMLYVFGLVGEVTKYARVIKVEPQGGEIVGISATCYNAIIHSFDGLTPPALTIPPIPPLPPDLPEIDFLTLTEINDGQRIIQASWSAAFGAQRYIVQISYDDGESWAEVGQTTQTSLQIQALAGSLTVRVAAINNGQGPWKEASITVGVVGALFLSLPFIDFEWLVNWFQVFNAIGYQVKVYDNTDDEAPVLKRTTDYGGDQRTFGYDYANAVTDGNITRHHLVTVDAEFDDGLSGEPAQLAITNPIPTAPQNPDSSFVSEDSDAVIYRLFWTVPHEDDLVRIKIWLSSTDGFDPEVEVPVLDLTLSAPGWEDMITEYLASVPLDSPASHPTYYWRAALFDVWGTEIETNITEQQVIAAYP